MRKNGILHGLVGSLLLLSIVACVFAPLLAPVSVVGALVTPDVTVELEA